MKGFDKCGEKKCKNYLESYQIIELVSDEIKVGFDRTLLMVARSNIYKYSIVKELFTPITLLRDDIQEKLRREILLEDDLGNLGYKELEPEAGSG
jgi:hypothetical protein